MLAHLSRMFLVMRVFFLKRTSFGKPRADREREERQNSGSVISADESISRKSRRNVTDDARSKISHSRLIQHEFSSDERDLREHLERRVRQAIIGENSAQRKLYSTENDIEYVLCESQRELESQRRQLRQASQWADHAQRERINLCSELERKNRLHQESYARSCQEIEELQRRCYKEENEDEEPLEAEIPRARMRRRISRIEKNKNMKIWDMLFTEVGVLLVSKEKELVDNIELNCYRKRNEKKQLRWLLLTVVS